MSDKVVNLDSNQEKVARDLRIREAIERAISICKDITTRIEIEERDPVVRALVVYSLNRTYSIQYAKEYEAFRKLGI